MALKNLTPSESTKRRVPRWAIIVLSGIALLGIAEAGARLLATESNGSESNTPSTMAAAAWQMPEANSIFVRGEYKHQLNDLGMRGDLPQSGKHVTAIIGGNAIFAAEASSDDETLPALVQAELRRRPDAGKDERDRRLAQTDDRFQVINAGSPRITLDDADTWINERALPGGAQAIVLMIGFDDLLAAFADAQSDGTTPPAARAIWESSALLSMIFAGDEDSSTRTTLRSSKDPAITAALKSIAAKVKRISEACTDNKVGVVIAIEPSIASSQGKGLAPRRLDCARALGLEMKALATTYERLSEMLTAFAGIRAGVFYCDLMSEMTEISDESKAPAEDERLYEPWSDQLGMGLSLAGRKRASRAISAALREHVPWDARPWSKSKSPK